MPSVVIHGTKNESQRAERIVAAIACVASLRFAKKVLILPMTLSYNVTDTIIGSKIKQNSIRSRGYSFDDSGVDALLRRFEQGTLNAEAFSDCSKNLSTVDNSFDLATNSKRLDLATYIVQNAVLIKKFLQEASKIYDLVIVLANADEEAALEVIENSVDEEVAVIPQGNHMDFKARDDAFYIVNNYDASSIYTFKRLKNIYSLPNERKIYPVSYNIRFKDACRSESAIDFFTANVVPDETDDNFIFIQNIVNIINAILGTEEPLVEEKRFIQKERPKRK